MIASRKSEEIRLTLFSRDQFILSMKGNKRTFRFRAQYKEQCQQWVEVIGKHIALSQGNAYRLSAPPSGEFWKIPQISEHQFI